MRENTFFVKLSCRSRPALYYKKDSHRRCFPVSVAKFFRTTFYQNITERWLLNFND